MLFISTRECCIWATAFRPKAAIIPPSSIAAAVPLHFGVFQDRTKRHRPERRRKKRSNTMKANTMKKFLLGTVGLIALAAPASAADLAPRPYTKAPPPMISPVYDWSGFYIGINGGWGQNRDCRSGVLTGADFGCHDANGGTAGGQIGYRWQSGGWVFGLEGQGNWADFSGSNVNLAFPAFTVRSKMDAFGL